MRRYTFALFLISIFFIVIGLISGKITGSSFEYISLTESLFAIIQILVVTLVILIAAMITLPALFIDLIMLLFGGFNFSLIHAIWGLVWSDYTIGWFWAGTSGSSILFASIILIVITGLMLRKRK